MRSYQDFLASKSPPATPEGLPPGTALSEHLAPFQRYVTSRALERGRCAVFAECGLGKTRIELEWARHVAAATHAPVLILTPLAVAHQFVDEGRKLGVAVAYATEGCPGREHWGEGVWVANYERLHLLAGMLPGLGGVVLDESSILKAYDGSTCMRIIESFAHVRFRLAGTATPSPNDVTELGNHAAFLGVMTRAEMLATYFVHDGGDTSEWRLKGHAREPFWSWVRSWAVALSKPSDLGFSDEGYDLPPLNLVEHVIDVDAELSRKAGVLFAFEASDLSSQREVRRMTLDERVRRAAAIVATNSLRRWVVWCELNDESKALTAAIPGAVEVTGSDSPESKEQAVLDFVAGKTRVLVSKPRILGFGVNLQCCSDTVFAGADYSYEKFHQTVRRFWRFGQHHQVDAHLISTSADQRVAASLEAKRLAHQAMVAALVASTREEKLTRLSHAEGTTATGRDWEIRLGDCVPHVAALPDAHVDFSCYSPPFASLYTYSASEHDMGNCRDHDTFFEQYSFLLRELLRATKPGRLSSVHCMIMPTSIVRDGVIGLTDFPGRIIAAHQAAGWVYHADVTIWKDPVTAMQRTKALGLLWKQIQKDSCMSRMGLPDRVLTFRKPGTNPTPVSHSKSEFPVLQWQKWASPVWDDINPSDTLQYQSAREAEDERHICPLQLEVTRRCVRLWSNPGDLVLSPFAGIGSEGHVALQEGRRFLGFELKPSYYQQAVANLEAACSKQAVLF